MKYSKIDEREDELESVEAVRLPDNSRWSPLKLYHQSWRHLRENVRVNGLSERLEKMLRVVGLFFLGLSIFVAGFSFRSLKRVDERACIDTAWGMLPTKFVLTSC